MRKVSGSKGNAIGMPSIRTGVTENLVRIVELNSHLSAFTLSGVRVSGMPPSLDLLHLDAEIDGQTLISAFGTGDSAAMPVDSMWEVKPRAQNPPLSPCIYPPTEALVHIIDYVSLGWTPQPKFFINELLTTLPTDEGFVNTAVFFFAIVEAK